jgi:general secretion pathway protein I
MGEIRKNSFREQGFTLLEVMIALAIISIALIGLLGLTNRSIEVNNRLQNITQATLLAQHKMAEVVGAEDFDVTQGSFDDPFSDYNWLVEYADTVLPSVTMVSVTVDWGDNSVSEAVTLDSFKY